MPELPPFNVITAVAAAILLLPSLLILQSLYAALTSPLHHLPGPWYTHFTHLRLKEAVITGNRIFYIDDLHKQYGPIVRISPMEVAVADLEAFKEIHRVGSRFLKSSWYQKLANFPVLGVFTMVDPKDHSQRRKLLSRPFSRTQLMEHWEQTVKETAALCVQKVKKQAMNGNADVFNWWMLLASDVSAHLAFGESFKMVEGGKETEFIRVLKALTMGAGIMVEMPFLRILRFVPLRRVQEMFNANDFIWRKAARVVALARRPTTSSSTNIFRNVIADSEKEEGGMGDWDVRMEAINIIIAGTDTTGTTLTYLTWAVLQRPALQAALEQEVGALDANFTDAELVELPLLNGVVQETLRLYGAAPSSLPRVVPKGGAKFAGHYMPEDVTVCTQAYTLHRDEKIWRNPLEFDPTRWLNSSPGFAMSADAKTAFHPFGAGARSCVGVHLARTEIRYAAAMLFRECKGLKLAESTTVESMKPVNFFLIAPKAHRCEVTLAGN